LADDDVASDTWSTLPPRRCIAAAKDELVRVDGS
jgi:hypothetical protein